MRTNSNCPVRGVTKRTDRAKRKVGMGGGEGLAVEALPVSRLLAVEIAAIPAGVADPGLDGLHRFCFIGHQRGFHYRCDDEHEGNPSNGGPNHEKWSFHSVVFLLQTSKKV